MCLLAEALVLEEEVKGLGLLTVVGDTDTRAGNDLAGVTLGIDLAETSPLTELGVVRDSHHVDAVLGAESLDELLVGRLRAVIGKDAEVHTALVEHAGTLAEAASDAIVAHGLLEDLLEGRDGVKGLLFFDDLLLDGGDFFNGGISAERKRRVRPLCK
jgi:hypothetical protein